MPTVDSTETNYKHIFTVGVSQGQDSILDLCRRVRITATKNYIEIGCCRVDIEVLHLLLKKHKEAFTETAFKTIQ